MTKYAIRNMKTGCWWDWCFKHWCNYNNCSGCLFDSWYEAQKELLTLYRDKDRPMDEVWEICTINILS